MSGYQIEYVGAAVMLIGFASFFTAMCVDIVARGHWVIRWAAVASFVALTLGAIIFVTGALLR